MVGPIMSDYIWYMPGTDNAYDLRDCISYRQDEQQPDTGWVRFRASNLSELAVPWESFHEAIQFAIGGA